MIKSVNKQVDLAFISKRRLIVLFHAEDQGLMCFLSEMPETCIVIITWIVY